MSEQQQVTEEQFVLAQRMESLISSSRIKKRAIRPVKRGKRQKFRPQSLRVDFVVTFLRLHDSRTKLATPEQLELLIQKLKSRNVHLVTHQRRVCSPTLRKKLVEELEMRLHTASDTRYRIGDDIA